MTTVVSTSRRPPTNYCDYCASCCTKVTTTAAATAAAAIAAATATSIATATDADHHDHHPPALTSTHQHPPAPTSTHQHPPAPPPPPPVALLRLLRLHVLFVVVLVGFIRITWLRTTFSIVVGHRSNLSSLPAGTPLSLICSPKCARNCGERAIRRRLAEELHGTVVQMKGWRLVGPGPRLPGCEDRAPRGTSQAKLHIHLIITYYPILCDVL